MVNPKIATSAEQPINRHAGLANYQGASGELVGLDASGNVVKADADSLALVPAFGVLFSDVDDGANYTADIVQKVVDANRTVPGQRVSMVKFGVEIENEDADWGFTPGERVFLAAGGGFTQAEPAGASGDIRQVLGVALTAERISLNVSDDYTIA